jgi:hypothetical protein
MSPDEIVVTRRAMFVIAPGTTAKAAGWPKERSVHVVRVYTDNAGPNLQIRVDGGSDSFIACACLKLEHILQLINAFQEVVEYYEIKRQRREARLKHASQ